MIISRQTKKAYLEHFFPDHVGAMNEHTTDRIFDGLETMLEHLLHFPSGQREAFAKALGNTFIEQANFILINENLACLAYSLTSPDDITAFETFNEEVREAYSRGFNRGYNNGYSNGRNDERSIKK